MYRISFPFFDDPKLLPDAQNRFPLFKRMVIPGIHDLFFMGLAQPLPTLVNFAEQQSKLVAAALDGEYAFPDAAEMERITVADEKEHLGHFYDSPRHRMQVDFNLYCRDLLKEIEKGMKRAKVPA